MPATQPPRYHYVYPRLVRAGLGNLLFPWARAVVAAEAQRIELLAGSWRKLRIGPLLRGDRDKRRYHLLFRRPSARVAAKRMWLLRTATLWSESGQLIRRGTAINVLVVDDVHGYFEPFAQERELILRALEASARPGVLSSRWPSEPYITLHVRLGDFRRPDARRSRANLHLRLRDYLGAGPAPDSLVNLSTPIGWFRDAVECLRSAGWSGPIVVCSDGTDAELRPLSSLAGVIVSRHTNALEDLMILAHAATVIGSGSSFSAWGAFLGAVPLYVAPGMNHFMSERFQVREVESWSSSAVHVALREDLASSRSHEREVPAQR